MDPVSVPVSPVSKSFHAVDGYGDSLSRIASDMHKEFETITAAMAVPTNANANANAATNANARSSKHAAGNDARVNAAEDMHADGLNDSGLPTSPNGPSRRITSDNTISDVQRLVDAEYNFFRTSANARLHAHAPLQPEYTDDAAAGQSDGQSQPLDDDQPTCLHAQQAQPELQTGQSKKMASPPMANVQKRNEPPAKKQFGNAVGKYFGLPPNAQEVALAFERLQSAAGPGSTPMAPSKPAKAESAKAQLDADGVNLDVGNLNVVNISVNVDDNGVSGSKSQPLNTMAPDPRARVMTFKSSEEAVQWLNEQSETASSPPMMLTNTSSYTLDDDDYVQAFNTSSRTVNDDDYVQAFNTSSRTVNDDDYVQAFNTSSRTVNDDDYVQAFNTSSRTVNDDDYVQALQGIDDSGIGRHGNSNDGTYSTSHQMFTQYMEPEDNGNMRSIISTATPKAIVSVAALSAKKGTGIRNSNGKSRIPKSKKYQHVKSSGCVLYTNLPFQDCLKHSRLGGVHCYDARSTNTPILMYG